MGHTAKSSFFSAAKNKVEDTAGGIIVGSESNCSSKISERTSCQQIMVQALGSINCKGMRNVNIMDTRLERIEAWR